MANDLDRLIAADVIHQVIIDLGPRRMAHRRLFLAKEMELGVTSASSSTNGTLLSDRASLGQLFAEFIGGSPVGNVIIDVSPPAGEGIRKFKAIGLRLWGWAADEQNLVLVRAASKSDLLNRIVRERDQGRLARDWMRAHNVSQIDKRPWYELFSLSNRSS